MTCGAEHCHDLENWRRSCAAGERCAQRLRRLSQFQSLRFGEGAHSSLEGYRIPRGIAERLRQGADERLGGRELRFRLVVHWDRTRRDIEMRDLGELDQCLGAGLQARHCRRKPLALNLIERPR
jgi:hypothetical protein